MDLNFNTIKNIFRTSKQAGGQKDVNEMAIFLILLFIGKYEKNEDIFYRIKCLKIIDYCIENLSDS